MQGSVSPDTEPLLGRTTKGPIHPEIGPSSGGNMNASTIRNPRGKTSCFKRKVTVRIDDHLVEAIAFFDEGATFHGINHAFVERLEKVCEREIVENQGTMPVQYADGVTRMSENKQVDLCIYIDDMDEYITNVQVCHVPVNADIMIGIPWKRECFPVIDWQSERIMDMELVIKEIQRHGQILEEKKITRAIELARETRFSTAPECLRVGSRRVKRPHIQAHQRLRVPQTCAERLHLRVNGLDDPIRKYFHCDFVHPEVELPTRLISMKQFRRILKKTKDEMEIIIIKPNGTKLANHQEREMGDTEKERRVHNTTMESFSDNPAYSLIQEYNDIFRTELPYGKPVHGEHEMELLPGTGAIQRPQWRQSPEQEKTIAEWVDKMTDAGLIRPSISPHGAPTFCVRKPNGWRIVHDYRAINEVTIRQTCPMPRKDRIQDSMHGAQWFSCFDLLSGFYQISMREKDIPLTAFQTPKGLYEFLVVPMGLCNAPATFNRIVRKIFRGTEDIASTYVDDVYVYTSGSIEEHLAALKRIFQRCRETKIYFKLSKSSICGPEIPCLGDFIGRNGIRIDPDKVSIIKNWPLPHSASELQQFLGTTVYVQRFCKGFARMAGPLFGKLKGTKRSKISFTNTEQELFEELKVAMTTTPVLRIADMSTPFGIRTDASERAIGGVLYQIEKGEEVPIAFTGRKLQSAESRYPIREKEMAAIIHALEKWRVYLLDGKVTVETDHESLKQVLKQKKIGRRMARWYDTLSEFNLEIKHIPGVSNLLADAISRGCHLNLSRNGVDLHDAIRKAQQDDPDIYALTKIILGEKEEIPKKFPERWSVAEGILYYQQPIDKIRRMVLPEENNEIRNLILWEFHDAPIAGHPGETRTYLAAREYYYWNRMERYIKSYVQSCERCQRMKSRRGKARGKLKPLQIPENRWASIGMDFKSGLTKTKSGFDAIMIVIDRLTKRAHFIATTTTVTTKVVARLVMREVIRLHGIPEEIISDRDSKFTSKFWDELATILGTKLALATAYHQQTDGQTERVIQILSEYLRLYTNANEDWDTDLAMAKFAYNRTTQASIGMSPFEADLGYNPRIPITLGKVKGKSDANTFVEGQAELLKLLRFRVQESQDVMKDKFDKGRKNQFFSKGDMVLLDTKNLKPYHGGYTRKKMGPRFLGPYKILEEENGLSYKLLLPPKLRLHPTFHTQFLKPYKEDENVHRDNSAPTVTLPDGTRGVLVKRVLGHRVGKSGDE